jgi:hypothetical protein
MVPTALSTSMSLGVMLPVTVTPVLPLKARLVLRDWAHVTERSRCCFSWLALTLQGRQLRGVTRPLGVRGLQRCQLL